MHVIFVEPAFPANQRQFVRALHEAGAHVTGIGESPVEALGDQLRSWLGAYEQVPSVVHEPSLHEAVRRIQARGWVDRLETTVEAHVSATAAVREACRIPGTSVQTAFLCRDKPAMKEALRQAGIACAQSTGASSVEEVREFAATVGYPLIIKPPDAAGAAGTYRADDEQQLELILKQTKVDQGASVAVEEFIEGHEGFFDTITVDGEVEHEFISHYYPNVLEAMRNRWISPQIVATNRVEADSYAEVREMGRRVIRELGIGTSATHMEWFFGPKGLKFSEIACRPPGVGAWDLYSAGNDMDLYREWAELIVSGRSTTGASRRYATGMINLRPDRDGRILGHDGMDELHRQWGEHIIDSHFPAPGTPTQSVEAGYMANAWLRMRHPDYDTLREMLDRVGQLVQVRAG